MLRHFLLAVLALMTLLGHSRSSVWADEIVIRNRLKQDEGDHLGFEEKESLDQSRLITAGELWQFFHDRGVTSVDQLTLNLDSGQDSLRHSGAIRFQIQDPNNGDILTNLSINSSSNRLEVPLEFDYMKRFSPGSKELIRLDLSDLDALAMNTTVSVEGSSNFFGSFNVATVVAFFSFWVVVFFVLNRYTKPERQELVDDIIIRSSGDIVDEPQEVETTIPVVNPTAARVVQQVVVSSNTPRSGHSKVLSAR